MTYTDVFGSATLPPSEYGYASFTLATNATFVWPYNTDGSSYPVAKVMDIACDAGNEITLPDCTEVSTGEDFLIRNIGANVLIVKDATGVQVASVAVGAASYFYLTDNTSAAGVFGVIGFGVGTSTADASSLVGYGIKAVGASLNQAHPVQPTNTGITLSADHRAKLIVFTGGVATFALDTAATLGDDYFTMFRNDGTGTATIDPAASELIDGMASMQVQPGESLMLICTGTKWYSVGYGRSTLYQFTQLTKDVSAGGTITLSATEAANKLITFIGNPSAAVNVVVPAVVAVYYTQSAVSTAHTITLKTSAGSGVGIIQGARVIALCDGTNVVSAQSAVANTSVSLTDGSALVPSLFFATQTNTGLFKSGTQDVGVTIGGSAVAVFGSTGLQTTTIGPNSTQRHTLPTVTSDTVTLNAATQTLTNKTFTSPTITSAALTGGTVDNAVIGGVTPAAGTFTTLTTTGSLELGNASDTTLTRSAAGVVTIEGVEVVTLSRAQTLTNKTLTAPVISTIVNTGTLTLPTSTDTLVGRATTDTLTNKTIALGNNAVSGTLAQFNTSVTDAELASLAGTETLTNKTISGSNNTLSNIGNTSLTNSSITINGNSVSLGGSTTVTATATNALTIGTGLSGTSYNGSTPVTVAIDSTVATLTGTQTLTNKTLTSPSITSPTISDGTANGVAYLNGSKVLTSGSALTFDGAQLFINGITVGRGAGAVSTNTAVGASALAANTTGSSNTAVGLSALAFNTTGTTNSALGLFALRSNTTGSNNTAVGEEALWQNTTASNNTAVGYQAAYSNTTGDYFTAVGFEAGLSTTTATRVTAVGSQALRSNTTGRNTAFGWAALYSNTTGTTNTALGDAALYSATTADGNTAVGYGSLLLNTTGNSNTAVGFNALRANLVGSSNTAVGYQAGYSNTTGPELTAVGYQAAYSNTTGADITAFGYTALRSNTTGTDNTGIGPYALRQNTTGSLNTALGNSALYANTTGSYNTALGKDALQANTTASNNTAVGYQAGYSQTAANGVGGNTFFGGKAGYSTANELNTFVGERSGYFITTGAKNTILGRYNGNQGGLDIRTASNNIVLSDGDGNPRLFIDGSGAVVTNSSGTVYSFSSSSGSLLLNNGSTDTPNLQFLTGNYKNWGIDSWNSSSGNANQYLRITRDLQESTGRVIVQLSEEGTLALGSVSGGGVPSIVNSGTGICFPATQNASSNANTLDDYERGTWTPTLGGSSGDPTVTYTVQVGSYTKIGNQVTVWGRISYSSKTGGSGVAELRGFPFTVGASNNEFPGCLEISQVTLTAGNTYANLRGISTTTYASLNQMGSGIGATNINLSGVGGTNGDLVFSLTYRV